MFLFHKKAKKEKKATKSPTQQAIDFAMYNAVSGNQRSSIGGRGEMCSGAMNNNQKFATLQMLRDNRD